MMMKWKRWSKNLLHKRLAPELGRIKARAIELHYKLALYINYIV